MFLKVWINLLALLIAFVSSPVTAQNEIQLTICLGEQVYLAGAPSFAGPLALTDPIGPASGPCGVNTAGSQVCGIGQIQSGNPPEPMYHCNPSMTTINNASTDDYVDGNGWFVSPDENTSYVITTQYLSTLGSNGSCSSKEQVYNVVVEECSSQIVGEESTNENSDEPITQSLGQTNCSESGTIIYADCPPNGEYFFILKPDGTIIDPYYGTGITFNQYNGQEVNYSVSATFASPCSIASEAVTLDCIEDATIYDFNWVVDFPFLGTYIIGNCDGVTVDAYLASNGSFWLLVDTPANGPQLFFEDGSLYCSGVSCLLSYGITGAPVDTYICGDVVIPDNVVEFNVCAGSNVFLPDFNPEAYLPPFGLNACYPSTTISPTTNTGGQSFTPDPNVVYTVTTTIIGPDGVSCGFYSPGSVFSYQAVVNLDDCAACPDPGNCSDNICYNGTEIWNFENCECETIPNDCSENTTQLSTTICQGAETIAPQLPAPSPPSFCSPSSLLLLNTTIEPMIGVSVEPIGFVLSPSQTTTYVITDNYFSAPDLPCPNNFPVTLLYTVYVEDCASCPDLGTCNTDCTQGDIEVWDENICQCVTSTQSVWGCTDPDATNYNPQANCESSCFYPAGFNGMTICEGETVTLPAGCVNDVGPGCPGPVGPQGGIIFPSVNTESFFDGFCNNINVTPTTTTTYTVTSFNGFTCSQETNIDLCWGDYTVLNYPTYTPPAGVTGCFPFPTIEPQIDLYSSCAFCPPPTNGVEVRPFESRTYELSLGDSVTSNPDCEAPASIIYNVNVELCDLSEFVIANNGSDNTTTCPSEYVVIGPYQLSDAVACPGPQFSFSPDPLGTYFSPAGLGSQVYFMVNPSTTTTYTYIDTPGCFGDTPQTTTVNVESCSGLQEIAICLGEEIQLAPPTFPTTPWWVGYQCIPQTTYVTASTGEALFVNQIITPQESATYTVTSNAALGTDQVYNCGSISSLSKTAILPLPAPATTKTPCIPQ